MYRASHGKFGLMLSQTLYHARLARLHMTAIRSGVGRTVLPYLLTARFQLLQFGLAAERQLGAVLIETTEDSPFADSYLPAILVDLFRTGQCIFLR